MNQLGITLNHYLSLGGLIDKIDFSKAYSMFPDENRGLKILSFDDLGETNVIGCKLMNFMFENGKVDIYSINWIMVFVDDCKVELNSKYL